MHKNLNFFSPLLLTVVFMAGCGKPAPPLPPPLSGVKFALEHLPKELLDGAIYANPAGYELLLAEGFPKLQPFAQDARLADAVINPSLWRQLDREHRFQLVFLAGDPAPSRALIQHFLQTRDWRPIHVDPVTLAFARVNTAWNKEQLATVEQSLASLTPQQQAMGLTQAAAKLIAIARAAEAEELLEKSLRLDAQNSETLTLQGVQFATRERWSQALEKAETALAMNAEFQAALYLQAQALFALQRFGEAAAPMEKLLRQSPDDPNSLFLKAKIARGLSRYEQEIEALEKIIADLEARKLSSAFYRVYLGQAYASNGESDKALENLATALADEELTPGQRDFAQRAYDRLREALESAQTP